MERFKVTWLPSKEIARVTPGTSLLEAAADAGVLIDGVCGGKGSCGKCRVRIVSGSTVAPSSLEKELLSAAELDEGWALACQRKVYGDLLVEAIAELQTGGASYSAEAKKVTSGYQVEVDDHLSKVYLAIKPPVIEDQLPDLERVLGYLPKQVTLELETLRTIPEALRQNNFKVTAVILENQLRSLEPGNTTSQKYGVALDVGTTTIAGYLLDLNSGKVLSSLSTVNLQSTCGADVISRIGYSTRRAGGMQRLQQLVVESVDNVIEQIVRRAGIDPSYIYELTAVGNTTMSHLLLGVTPANLASAPFIPAFKSSIALDAGKLGLKSVAPWARLVVLPGVAGYVGPDTVGVMLAAALRKRVGNWLAVDIGTNGEIVLSGKGRLLTCSTAAGPAFEGGKIKQGMRAEKGAVYRVKFSSDVKVAVVGNIKPVGICGSGLIDAISELARVGIVGKNGGFNNPKDWPVELPEIFKNRVRSGKDGREFVLVKGEPPVVIGQKDIMELLLAKGAIRAGIEVLLRELAIEASDLDGVLLAGAFGSNLDKKSILGIGLLPEIDLEKITPVGNAAGIGALMALGSISQRELAAELAWRAEHIELSTHPGFQKQFIKALSFPPVKKQRLFPG